MKFTVQKRIFVLDTRTVLYSMYAEDNKYKRTLIRSA